MLYRCCAGYYLNASGVCVGEYFVVCYFASIVNVDVPLHYQNY